MRKLGRRSIRKAWNTFWESRMGLEYFLLIGLGAFIVGLLSGS